MMGNRLLERSLTILVLLLVFGWLSAQSFQYGVIVSAKVNVHLRDAPPSGLFYQLGKEIGTVRASERLRVLERREIRVLFTTYEWLKVERLDPPADQPTVGWVYSREGGGPSNYEEVQP